MTKPPWIPAAAAIILLLLLTVEVQQTLASANDMLMSHSFILKPDSASMFLNGFINQKHRRFSLPKGPHVCPIEGENQMGEYEREEEFRQERGYEKHEYANSWLD